MPVFLGALGPMLATLGRWLILTYAGQFILKGLAAAGLAFATYELAVQPAIDNAVARWHAIPATLAQWLSAVGVDAMASILLSAYAVSVGTRVFLSKRH